MELWWGVNALVVSRQLYVKRFIDKGTGSISPHQPFALAVLQTC